MKVSFDLDPIIYSALALSASVGLVILAGLFLAFCYFRREG